MAVTQALRYFPIDLYTIEPQPLGAGSTATVYLAKRRNGNVGGDDSAAPEQIALKVLKPQPGAKELLTLQREASAMLAFAEHPNIVHLHGAHFSHNGFAMALDYVGGNFSARLQEKTLEEDVAAHLMGGTFAALAYIHLREIIHRDVKTENLLIKDDGQTALTDFGSSVNVNDEVGMSRIFGTPGFMAPELICREPYNAKVDCFSAGVVMYVVVYAKLPFRGPDTVETLRQTTRAALKFGNRVVLSETYKECVRRLLVKNPAGRSSSVEALGWFGGDVQEDECHCQRASTNQSSTRAPEEFSVDWSCEGHVAGAATAYVRTKARTRDVVTPDLRSDRGVECEQEPNRERRTETTQ